MTLRDLIESDVSSVFLNKNEFAETITRYPDGTGAGVGVTAIVFIGEEEFDDVEGAWIRRGSFSVADSVLVNREDKFDIHGTRHNVESISTAEFGMKEVGFIVSRRTMRR